MINCIAIDDEPLALKQIEGYISKTPYLQLANSFDNAIQALEYLQDNQVDLMYVDINMPDLNGMEFVKSLTNAPKVIFTTAYSEYAIEGFKVSAIDYLLKPIGYADFVKASEKAKTLIELESDNTPELTQNSEFIFIKSEYKIVKIRLADIKYLESMREYVRIHLLNAKPIMTLSSMKKIEQLLPKQFFMRVHRSYLVNLEQVSTIERNRIVFDSNTYIPVSEQYQSEFKKFIDNHFLN